MKEGIEHTKFLEDIIVFETEIFKNIFLNELSPKSKKQNTILYNVFKISCCKSLFEPQENKSHINPLLYLSEGLGYYLKELRQKQIPDNQICETIICSRNSFLKEYGLPFSYNELVASKKCIRMYDSVQQELIRLLE